MFGWVPLTLLCDIASLLIFDQKSALSRLSLTITSYYTSLLCVDNTHTHTHKHMLHDCMHMHIHMYKISRQKFEYLLLSVSFQLLTQIWCLLHKKHRPCQQSAKFVWWTSNACLWKSNRYRRITWLRRSRPFISASTSVCTTTSSLHVTTLPQENRGVHPNRRHCKTVQETKKMFRRHRNLESEISSGWKVCILKTAATWPWRWMTHMSAQSRKSAVRNIGPWQLETVTSARAPGKISPVVFAVLFLLSVHKTDRD